MRKRIAFSDAQVLEENEVQQRLNHNTKRAINQTYSTNFVSKGREAADGKPGREVRVSLHPFTKKRHKLSGKRKWKNKHAQYLELNTHMTVQAFNKKQAADKVLERLYKERRVIMKDALAPED